MIVILKPLESNSLLDTLQSLEPSKSPTILLQNYIDYFKEHNRVRSQNLKSKMTMEKKLGRQ